MATEWIGWFATGLFAASYAAKSPRVLRMIQALAACFWIAYGSALGAAPVVAANAIVAVAAIASARRGQPDGQPVERAEQSTSTIETLSIPARVGAFVPFAGIVNWQTEVTKKPAP